MQATRLLPVPVVRWCGQHVFGPIGRARITRSEIDGYWLVEYRLDGCVAPVRAHIASREQAHQYAATAVCP